MEIITTQPLDTLVLPIPEFNFLQLEMQLKNELKKYENLIFDDTQISIAKSDRANLNKLKKALEDQNREIKKVYLAPIEQYQANIKRLVALVDLPVRQIDQQIKTFEKNKKDAKLEEMKLIYTSIAEELEELVPFSKINYSYYLTAPYNMDKIKKEMQSTVERIKKNLYMLDNLDFAEKQVLKVMYLKDLDLGKALQEKINMERKQKEIKRYERNEQLEQKAKVVAPAPDEKRNQFTLKFTLSAQEQSLFKAFLTDNNLQFEQVL